MIARSDASNFSLPGFSINAVPLLVAELPEERVTPRSSLGVRLKLPASSGLL
jgi:hypothetical protein